MVAVRTPLPSIPLSQFAEILGIHPGEVNGLCGCASDCCQDETNTWFEFGTSTKRLSRRELLRALYLAEWEIARFIETPLSPQIIIDENNEYPNPQTGMFSDTDGTWKPVKTQWSNILAFGQAEYEKILDVELIESTIDVTIEEYIAKDVSLPVGFDVDEWVGFYLYHSDNNVGYESGTKMPRIPFTYTIDTDLNIITVRVLKHDLINPSQVINGCCDESTNAICIAVDVQLYGLKKTVGTHGSFLFPASANCGGNTPCVNVTRDLCLIEDDNRHGWVKLASVEFNNTDLAYNRQYRVTSSPNRYKISYVAGLPLTENGYVQEPFASAVVWLAMAKMLCDVPHCQCEECLSAKLEWARGFPTFVVVQDVQGATRRDIQSSPRITAQQIREIPFLPISNGALLAWQYIQSAFDYGYAFAGASLFR